MSKEASKTHYERNKNVYLKRNRERRYEISAFIRSLRAAAVCEDCGFRGSECPAAIDFHHVDAGDKDDVVARGRARGWSHERILEEIAKCKVLCANCHRKEHFNKRT